MFSLLTDQEELKTHLESLTDKEFKDCSNNLMLIITLLNGDVKELLVNRRVHGMLLPQQSQQLKADTSTDLSQVTLAQCINSQSLLTHAINSLCLTEAIVVRDNFINVLELISGEQFITEQINEQPINAECKVEKSNVSPINLTAIKQRIEKANLDSNNKKDQIKNKLNSLLNTDAKKSNISQQA